MVYSVKLSQIAEEHSLGIAYAAPDYDDVLITSADLNRPGIQLLGHLKYYDTDRLQIIGNSEHALLGAMSPHLRREAFRCVMRERGKEGHVPAVIIAHNVAVMPECIEVARECGVSVLTTDMNTSEFYAQLIGTLRRHLAPRQTVHGGLVEVHGEGMLITGDSGIGKSETALELIKRGHRLIADDAVEILRTSRDSLMGRSPAIIQYFMELRGIGVINVRNVYGIGAVKPSCPIDLVVSLEAWDDSRKYDRLGIETETTSFLDVSLPLVTIPVRPGRNLAVILEIAAMTNRQKKFGYNAAEELASRIDASVDAGISF